MAQATWHALMCEAVRWRRLKKPAQAIECLVMSDSYNSRPATIRIPDPHRRLALFSDN